jgi:hypothetical protein
MGSRIVSLSLARELRMLRISLAVALLLSTLCPLARAADPLPPIPRIFPPVGTKPDEATAKKLRGLVEELEKDLKPFDQRGKDDAASKKLDSTLFADVAIYPKAIRYALDYDEFYKPSDITDAEKLLVTGRARLKELQDGVKEPSWTKQKGLVVRGYISVIDDSVQPYGLHIPEDLDLSKKPPLYVWLHGRQEKTCDLQFVNERAKSKGKFAADDAITVHPFGRYNNAFKFAGERDVLYVMFHVERHYQTDPARRVLMGFSMGGAGCWHIGAHYPNLFCAMAPGAGFSESRRFLKIKDDALPPWYEQILWQWYDVPSYTRNLFNLPVIAYSGEKDGQKQAADVMEAEFAKHGRKLNHIIGPNMGHDYDKASLEKIRSELKAITSETPAWQKQVSVQTPLPLYGDAGAVAAKQLIDNWHNAQIDVTKEMQAELCKAVIKTQNVSELDVDLPQLAQKSLDGALKLKYEITIDGETVDVSSGSHHTFYLHNKKWGKTNTIPAGHTGEQASPKSAVVGLEASSESSTKPATVTYFPAQKTAFALGTIDHAYCAPFAFVTPSGKPKNPERQAWVERELKYQIDRWRRTFRGDVRVIKDTEVTEHQRRKLNLVLWGDADSNAVIRDYLETAKKNSQHGWTKLLQKQESANTIIAGIYPVNIAMSVNTTTGPVLSSTLNIPFSCGGFTEALFPDAEYVVFNSGPTFRDEHDKNNANQIPKLPDWAVIDVTTPGDAKSPGKIVTAGFFDKDWKYVDPAKQRAEFEARQSKK